MLATPCDKEILSTLNQTVNKFKAIGYETEELTPPAFEKSLEPFIILAGQAALLVEDKINVILGRARNQETETEIVKSLRQRIATELPPLSAERLLLCWYQVDRLRLEMVEFFTKFDFIIAPVAASSAPLHGATTLKINGKECGSEQVYHFASAANVLALPALAFPTGTAKNGLPLGLQIIGPRFSDRELIRALATVGVI